ncbi:MAG: hypothetical protein AB7E34_10860 [Acidaminococcaceae bacterium]
MFRNRNKLFLTIVVFVVTIAAVFYLLCYLASVQAARIFNEVVAEQRVMKGTLTVETLRANVFGTVSFDNLVWKDDAGNLLANIPQGSFKVKPWDVLTGGLNTKSVTYIELRDASINMNFDNRMYWQHLDVVKPSPAKKNLEKLQLKDFNIKLLIVNSTIDTRSGKRNFKLQNINAAIEFDSKKSLFIDFQCGNVSGTFAADALRLNGAVDLTKTVAVYDNINLNVTNCNMSAFGIGNGKNEKGTVQAVVTGEVPMPVITGTLNMKRLKITPMHFSNVKGNFKYENGIIDVPELDARVFAGKVKAKGNYNIDNRSYMVDLVGSGLHGDIGLNDPQLHCLVDLNAHLRSDGNPKNLLIYGDFKSGEGSYGLLDFDSLEGTITSQHGILDFRDVYITIDGDQIFAPYLRIVKGKLKLGAIYYESNDGKTKKLM